MRQRDCSQGRWTGHLQSACAASSASQLATMDEQPYKLGRCHLVAPEPSWVLRSLNRGSTDIQLNQAEPVAVLGTAQTWPLSAVNPALRASFCAFSRLRSSLARQTLGRSPLVHAPLSSLSRRTLALFNRAAVPCTSNSGDFELYLARSTKRALLAWAWHVAAGGRPCSALGGARRGASKRRPWQPRAGCDGATDGRGVVCRRCGVGCGAHERPSGGRRLPVHRKVVRRWPQERALHATRCQHELPGAPS